MAILFSNEILNSVKTELGKATDSVQIISAYCKESTFVYLNECIAPQVREKRLLVRFRLDDLVKGSSDFSVIECGMKNGWQVYIRFDLHAKTYIIDNLRGLIGSANATNSGLSIGKNGNMEMATLVNVESKDIEKINKLFYDAIHVDNEVLEKLRDQFNDVKTLPSKEYYSWDEQISALFKPHIETLFSYELPEKKSFVKGEYISFLDEIYTDDIEKIKTSFRWSNAYLWLISVLKESDGCLYFGALSEKLHGVLVSDPKPYRRDVKSMLSNLLCLIEELQMEEICIDRPNYSQRVRLIGASYE